MALEGRYLFTASMDVSPEREDLFNELYDAEHVPMLSRVPGVISATRFRHRDLTMMIEGEPRRVKADGESRYSTVYELSSPAALLSEEWSRGASYGRWPKEVRPFLSNLRFRLYERAVPPS